MTNRMDHHFARNLNNHMYDGFKFDSCPNFQDDLSKKPFMQRLWSGKNLHATEDELIDRQMDYHCF